MEIIDLIACRTKAVGTIYISYILKKEKKFIYQSHDVLYIYIYTLYVLPFKNKSNWCQEERGN